MSDQTFTIADLEKMVAEHEASAIRVKTIINELCVKGGLPPRYATSELQQTVSESVAFRDDQFHGRPLATCVKEYLAGRRHANIGPATTNEIFDALTKGGYEFGARNEAIARVSTYNSLTKNPAFYKLPNKKWGLREWYPNAKHQPDGDQESDTKESTKTAADKTGAAKLKNVASTKSDTVDSLVKRESGSVQVQQLLDSDPTKKWGYGEILSKVTGVKRSSIAAFLFSLQREGKAKKVGYGIWQSAK